MCIRDRGYPIWWYDAAWPVDGFVAANDFTGKTVIPFCTSSSSGPVSYTHLTMAFVDPDSTSGNLVPTAEIIQAFPDDNLNSDMLHTNGDFFEAVSFSGSHQAGLQAVVKGDVDVAPISDQILASEIANGNASESDVKIIHESGAIPAEAMVVAEHVDQETCLLYTSRCV